MPGTEIPRPVIAVVAEELAEHYTHTAIDNLFDEIGAPPGPPPSTNKVDKVRKWLSHINGNAANPLSYLGPILYDYMEGIPRLGTLPDRWKMGRDRIARALEKCNHSYIPGGQVSGASLVATRTLKEILEQQDMEGVALELERCLETVSRDPPAALTSACAIIEALCCIYIDERGLEMPNDRSIKKLWRAVQIDLGLDPAQQPDQDITRILGGLSSVVDGIGALRTHAGSAHGRSLRYRVAPRHARLAIHAAQTLVLFVMETWQEKRVCA